MRMPLAAAILFGMWITITVGIKVYDWLERRRAPWDVLTDLYGRKR